MARTSIPENPYLAARQEWNERYGSYVKAAAAWRIVGITGMLMAVIGFSYALYQSTQVKLVPYIVEVDKLGTAATAGYPQQIEYADPRVVRATLDQGPRENFCRPAADPLLRSAAQVYGPGVLCLVLTGMGSDGLEGARAVVDQGGRVVVQDAATSVVWGMPGAVATAGLAHEVLPLGSIAARLAALSGAVAIG